MKTLTILFLAAAISWSQASSKYTVVPGQGDTSTGSVDFRELYKNGQNYVGLKAPASISSSFRLTLPTALPSSANSCMSVSSTGTISYQPCSGDLKISDYNWTQISSASTSPGTVTATLTPCPLGVSGTNTHHSVRIGGGGTPETVVITGGTCTSGAASGTIQFTTVNSHSVSWTMSSASGGLQEAINVSSTVSARVLIPLGVTLLSPAAPGENAPVCVQGPLTLVGVDTSVNGGSELRISDNNWAIEIGCAGSGGPVHFEKFAIQGGAMASGGGIRVTSPAYHNCFSTFMDMQFYTLPTGIDFVKACGQQVHRNLFYGYTNVGIRMRNTYSTDAGDQAITSNDFLVLGAGGIGTTAILWESAGGGKIIGNKFNTQGRGIDMTMNAATIISVIQGNSFDNQTEFSVKIRVPGTGFLGVNITGNVVTGAGGVGYTAFDIGDDTVDDVFNVVISSNNIQAAGTGVKIGAVDQAMIIGNIFGLLTKGIDVKAAATGIAFGPNQFYGVATPYSIADETSIRATYPGYFSGYTNFVSSSTNLSAVMELFPPAVGAVNNAILLHTTATGANSQRVLSWSNGGRFCIARSNTNRTTAEQEDYCVEADGTAKFNFGVGIQKAVGSSRSLDVSGRTRSTLYETETVCTDSAGAAACGTSAAGTVVIDAGATSVVVSTTAVTTGSQIFVQFDSSVGGLLGITCNTTYAAPYVTARTAGTSFTFTIAAAPAVNRACFSFFIVN